MHGQSRQHFVVAFFDACHNHQFIEKTSMEGGGEQSFEQGLPCPLLVRSPRWNNQKTHSWCLPLDDFHKSKDVNKSAPWEFGSSEAGSPEAFLHHNLFTIHFNLS